MSKKMFVVLVFLVLFSFCYAEELEAGEENDRLTWFEALIMLNIVLSAFFAWGAYSKVYPLYDEEKGYFRLWKTQIGVGLAALGLKNFGDETIRKQILYLRSSFLLLVALMTVLLLSTLYGFNLTT
ncbi:hypothetical protein GOV05_04055, partial [Candidatus Woesearchaeota archaeon]|nr:hypothetical protein [Candidatus Woesearchaeota archaeon]